jgi:hypothetical protein
MIALEQTNTQDYLIKVICSANKGSMVSGTIIWIFHLASIIQLCKPWGSSKINFLLLLAAFQYEIILISRLPTCVIQKAAIIVNHPIINSGKKIVTDEEKGLFPINTRVALNSVLSNVTDIM